MLCVCSLCVHICLPFVNCILSFSLFIITHLIIVQTFIFAIYRLHLATVRPLPRSQPWPPSPRYASMLGLEWSWVLDRKSSLLPERILSRTSSYLITQEQLMATNANPRVILLQAQVRQLEAELG